MNRIRITVISPLGTFVSDVSEPVSESDIEGVTRMIKTENLTYFSILVNDVEVIFKEDTIKNSIISIEIV